MGRGVFQFKSFWDTAHVQMMYPPPTPRIAHTDARLFMNMVQIWLISQDSRIPGFQLDLKIVNEFQLWQGSAATNLMWKSSVEGPVNTPVTGAISMTTS
jgi:hypothetical protein